MQSGNDQNVCGTCNVEPVFNRKREKCKRCYGRWYRQTQVNSLSERKRLGEYRQHNPAKTMLSVLKSKAKRERRAFDLEEGWIQAELDRGTCAVSGVPVEQKPYREGKRRKRTQLSPSIDRIDNERGYTQDNCRLVCWGVNLLKNDGTDAIALMIAQGMVAARNRRGPPSAGAAEVRA